MSVDESEVRAAAEAVVDPTLRLTLGQLGMVGSVHARRRRVSVEVDVPVADYPGVDELTERVRAAVSAVDGADELTVTTAAMGEEVKAHLRALCAAAPSMAAIRIMPITPTQPWATKRDVRTRSWHPARRRGSSASRPGKEEWASRRSP